MVANLRRGPTGRQMIAVRSNERAAAGLGINVVGIKLYAFAVGAGIAGLGGVLLAFQQTNVQFTSFDVFGSILLVQYAVIGGLGWISGVVAAPAPRPGRLVSPVTNDLFPNLTTSPRGWPSSAASASSSCSGERPTGWPRSGRERSAPARA